jgi:hypothetical protein
LDRVWKSDGSRHRDFGAGMQLDRALSPFWFLEIA